MVGYPAPVRRDRQAVPPPNRPARAPLEAPHPVRVRRHREHRRIGSALRLAAFHAIILVAVLGIVVIALMHEFTIGYQSLAESSLTDQLDNFSAALAASPDEGPYALASDFVRSGKLAPGQELLIAVRGHGIVGTTDARDLDGNATISAWLVRPPAGRVGSQLRIDGRSLEVLAAPVRVDGAVVGTVVAATALTALEAQRHRVLVLSIAEAAAAIVAGTLSAYLLLRRLLRTVGRITTTAEEIGQGDLDRRLGDHGSGDEVSRLAGTFDAMLDRIATVLDGQRRLLTDVSHQLRTPMTVARGHLEVLARTGYDDRPVADETVALVLDELARMSDMVNSLLLLGRSMERDFLQEEPVDVRSLLAEVHDAATVLAPRRWSMDEVADVVVWGDAGKLRGALLNLIDNAVKATSAGDTIALSCRIDAERRAVVLAVDDAGPGVPEQLRATVLQRFGRLPDDPAPGSGLGLAIVDAVARAHGGWVEIGDSPLGGARVAMALSDRRRWQVVPVP